MHPFLFFNQKTDYTACTNVRSTSQQICRPHWKLSYAEPQHTSCLIRNCLTETRSNLTTFLTSLLPQTRYALTPSYQRHSIQLLGMLLHEKESVSNKTMLRCRCKATTLICCRAQLSIAGGEKLAIMQRSFSCKMKSACLISKL